MSCLGFSNTSEFTIYNECRVSILADKILKSSVIGFAAIILIIECCIIFLRYQHIQQKNVISRILLIWTMFQGPFMSLRAILGLALNLKSISHIGMAFLTHIEGITAAGVVILFIYIELSIIHRGTIKKNEIFLMTHRGKILIAIHILQSLAFLIGPLLSYYARIPAHIVFWVPVIIIDFTIIPYFCFLGIIIYQKISKMIHKKYKSVSKHILITVLFCSVLGLFTGSAGIYLIIDTRLEWIFVELCWLSDVLFNGIIFFILIRKQKKRIPSNTSSPHNSQDSKNNSKNSSKKTVSK